MQEAERELFAREEARLAQSAGAAAAAPRTLPAGKAAFSAARELHFLPS